MPGQLQLSIVNFKKASYIIVEGKQKADYFYIIRTGKIKLTKEVEIVEEEGGNILTPGDFFGVVSTISLRSVFMAHLLNTSLPNKYVELNHANFKV